MKGRVPVDETDTLGGRRWNLRAMASARDILAEIHGFWKTMGIWNGMLVAIDNEDDWLQERRKYLTASDAGSYCGINPFDRNGRLVLWEEKTGRRDRPDIGGSEAVRFGKEAEDVIRQLFMVTHPDWTLEYNRYGLEVNPKYPWMASTLDGVLHNRYTGKVAILEIKTTTIRTADRYKLWKNSEFPKHYIAQTMHQLITKEEADEVFLFGFARVAWNPLLNLVVEQNLKRSECSESLAWVLAKSKEMHRLIEEDERPDVVLSL